MGAVQDYLVKLCPYKSDIEALKRWMEPEDEEVSKSTS